MKIPMYVVALCSEFVSTSSHIDSFMYFYTFKDACLAGDNYVKRNKDDFGIFTWYHIYKLTK